MSDYLPAATASELPALIDQAQRLMEKVELDLRTPDPIVLFDDIADVFQLEDAVVSKRRAATAPYYEAKSAIEGAFRPAAKAVDRAKKLLEDWFRHWGSRSLDGSGSVRVIHPDVTVRTVWAYDIVDPALVPREFLMVNEEAIEEHVDQFGDSVPIPGVRVFRTIKVQRRPRK
ncbi:MAG: hypothetical protein KatS3mg015_2854 [Fimbriimonadales bacterium]|nr:MAG: hypothetical protein KatS3mg015_2854 [Fimbriimonadales bacterium]